MNTTANPGLSHPLVVAYLADLDKALSAVDPQERVDTIAAVNEHLADALAGDAELTTARVEAVLAELGPVDQIAASATPAQVDASEVTATPAPDERGGWVAPALLIGSILSLLLPFLGAILAMGCLVAALVLLRGAGPRRNMLRATVAVSIVTIVFTGILAVSTLALTSFSTTESSVSTSAEPASPIVTTIPATP